MSTWNSPDSVSRSAPATPYWLLGILAVTALLYWAGVTPAFSADDYVHLSRSVHFDGLAEALGVFTTPDGREYRPLVRLSLWLNDGMGSTALPFHVTNLLLHLLSTALVFGLTRAAGASVWGALAGAALFALHPIHTTSVHFIMGRTDLLATAFYLASVWVGLRAYQRQSPALLIPSVLLAMGALASKEVAVSLPVAMLLACVAGHIPKNRPDALRCFLYTVPVGLLTLLYFVIRVVTLPESAVVGGYMQFSPGSVVSNYAQWAFALLYPWDLYQARFLMETEPLFFLAIAGALAALVGALLLVWVWPRCRAVLRNPLLWLGLLWVVVTLLPMAGGNAHRWYLYLPSVGLSLFLAALFDSAQHGPWRKGAAGALAGLLLLCAAETTRQSFIWHEQHQRTEQFFDAFEDAGLLHVDELYLANVPFGYKSAFMFSFESLENALELRYGSAPDIYFLSYMNLGDTGTPMATAENGGLRTRIELTPYSFYLLPPAQRRVVAESTVSVGDWKVTTEKPSSGGHIKELLISPRREPPGTPIYYYDGERFNQYGL